MSNSVTDLEEVLKTWAWTQYMKTKNGSGVRFDDAQIDVIWDRVRVVSGQANLSKENLQSDFQSQILFSSTFDNETNQFQHHNFQTQRTTLATVTTKVCKGFTRGVNTGIKLAVPEEVLRGSASFGNEVTVDSENETTTQHAVTWAVNTTVKAPQQMRTLADLEVSESQFQCSFKLNVSLAGRVIVKISDVSGRFLMTVQNPIAQILRDLRDTVGIPHCVDMSDDTKVVWPVIGTLKFRFGVTQRVRVRQEELPDEEEEDEYEYFN